MATINISARRALKDEFHKKRQAILIITTDLVMKNIITSMNNHMTDNPDYIIIYLQFTNCGGRGSKYYSKVMSGGPQLEPM